MHPHFRLLNGIAVGGLASVMALDIAEIVGHGLDPVVKYLDMNTTKNNKITGAQIEPKQQLPPINSNSVDKQAKEIQKQKLAKEKRRNIIRRVIRVLLIAAFAYLLVMYVSPYL